MNAPAQKIEKSPVRFPAQVKVQITLQVGNKPSTEKIDKVIKLTPSPWSPPRGPSARDVLGPCFQGPAPSTWGQLPLGVYWSDPSSWIPGHSLTRVPRLIAWSGPLRDSAESPRSKRLAGAFTPTFLTSPLGSRERTLPKGFGQGAGSSVPTTRQLLVNRV